MKPKQLIIIGGGVSIKEGIEKGLWNKLKGKFVIGINFSYNYFPNPTLQCYLDKQVREKNLEDFEKMGLVVTKLQPQKNHPNELQITTVAQYHRDLSTGIYKGSLTGIYTVSLGIFLLDVGEIYLLGYDYGALKTKDKEGKATIKKDKQGREISHFYQGDIEHRGIGKVNYYRGKGKATADFGVFENEKKVKIYNVSPLSELTVFPKLTYDEFFQKLDNNTYNQEELRKEIRTKLTPLVSIPKAKPKRIKKKRTVRIRPKKR